MRDLASNQSVAVSFFALTILFIAVSMMHEPFFNWIYDRHHNPWSWYIRPLFLIPFCYFAYKHHWAGIAITLFCLFTSMFWFPKPYLISEDVKEFLQFEKEYLYGEWDLKKWLMTLTIPVSLFALALSFWKRSLIMGIGVVVLMATGKVVWSIQHAGESGRSILFPAVTGLVICCGLIFYGFKRLEKNGNRPT